MPSDTRHLIVNADDFGVSEGINRGIVESHVRGIVTSASLMVDGAAAGEAAALAREHPKLSVGLHWEAGDTRLDNTRAIRNSFERQLEAFASLLGVPTHVDSHHHAHRDEAVSPLFEELVAPLGVPLRGDGRVAYVGGFYAQWEWGVTNLEYVSVSFLERLLRDEVGEGWTELGCHPGYRSPGFDSVYLEEREAEVRTLTDPRVGERVDELGIRLASYRDFAAARAGTR